MKKVIYTLWGKFIEAHYDDVIFTYICTYVFIGISAHPFDSS